MTLGMRLRALRHDAGLTQVQLAARLNYDHSAVTRWETGRNYPDMATLVVLADSYGVTLDWLITGRTSQHRDGRLLIGAGA